MNIRGSANEKLFVGILFDIRFDRLDRADFAASWCTVEAKTFCAKA